MAYDVTQRFIDFVSNSSGREFEFKAVIGVTTYDKTKVINFTPEFNIVGTEEFSLGIICVGKLTIEVKTTDSIAYNAKIVPYVRLWGWELVGEVLTYVSSEWVPLGGFKIDQRSYANGVYTFTCYDKLIETNQKFVSALTYPATMASVFDEIVAQLSFTVDSSVVIDPTYTIDYKDEDITIHDMLSYIASAHASSVRMTKDEKLIFVQYSPLNTKTAIAANQAYPATKPTNPIKTYTKVSITYNKDGEVYTAGSGDLDHTLSFYNQFATQTIATAVYNAINGLSYVPCVLDWIGFIWLEVGDMVTVTMRDSSTFDSILMCVKESYKGGLKSSCKAITKTKQQSEYQYEGKFSKMLNNAVQKEENYYGVVIGQDHGIRVDKLDGSGYILLNADYIQIVGANDTVVFNVDSLGQLNLIGKLTSGNCTIDPIAGFIYEISETARVCFSNTIAMQRYDMGQWYDVLYFDAEAGTYKFTGDIVLSDGQITWEKLDGTSADEGVTTIAENWISVRKIKISELTSINEGNPIIYLFTHQDYVSNSTSNTVTLGFNASTTDDTYNGMTIEIISGTGAGQIKTITDYAGGLKVAYVDSAWDTLPDETSVYLIKGPSIDATEDNEQGIGQEIRFKWNKFNYLRYGPNEADFYFTNDNGGKRPNVVPTGFRVGSTPVALLASDIDIVYNAGGTGFTVTADGVSEAWTWTKDANGRITQLSSATGRSISVTY